MSFFIGLLILAGGFASIYYSEYLVEFGRIGWAENNLGGTRAFYVLIGFVIVVIGLMIMLGLIDFTPDTNTIQLQGI